MHVGIIVSSQTSVVQLTDIQYEKHKTLPIHMPCYSGISGHPRECLFTYFTVNLKDNNNKKTVYYSAVLLLINIRNMIYFFHCCQIIWITMLTAPWVNMTLKMHSIHKIVHFGQSFSCWGQCTTSTVGGIFEEVTSIIITYRTYMHI